jgi:hypothetical protein
MHKCCLALALALGWVPTAFAEMPPCPKQPLRVDPLQRAGDGSSSTTPYWYMSYYELLGNPLVVGVIQGESGSGPTPESTTIAKAGKCEVRVPVPLEHASSGSVSLNPTYPDGAGFGIVALPDLRYNTPGGLRVRYTLGFSVDNHKLAEAGEWLDIAQLEFRWNEIDDHKDPAAVSAVYRIRKTQLEKDRLAIEVIEVRTPYAAVGSRPPVFERVVATITAKEDASATPIALRWSQVISTPEDDKASGDSTATGNIIIGPPTLETKNEVASFLEVIGPGDRVLYGMPLPGQWANSLSMGLLNYNIGKESDYSGRYGAEMMGTSLCAETMDAPSCPEPF